MDHNDLDRILRAEGWSYDNGWTHDSIMWDCYNDDNYGRIDPCFIILSRDGAGRVLKLSDRGATKEEIWRGPLVDEQGVADLLAFMNKVAKK